MSPQQASELRKLLPEEIPLGQQLPFDIFDEQGSLFKAAGLRLRKQDIIKSRVRLASGIFVRFDEKEEQQRKAIIQASIDQVMALKVGDELTHNIFDDRGRLIQAAGTLVTIQLVYFLTTKTFRAICVEKKTIPKEEAPKHALFDADVNGPDDFSPYAAQQLDRQVRNLLSRPISTQIADQPPLEKKLELRHLRQEMAFGQAQCKKDIITYAQIARESLAGKAPDLMASEKMIYNMAHVVEQDPNLALLLMDFNGTHDGDYLFNHGMNTSLVAMRVAGRLGWDKQSVQTLGVAALIQDIGMLQIPDEIRMARRKLNDEEWVHIKMHPYFTVNQLQKCEEINPLVMLLAFQAHELGDGSGYPRSRRTGTIHPLAHALHAADIYAAMTNPRPFRKAHSPYDTVVYLLNLAREGKIDKAVARAFIDCVSLFPVGSYVRLSDGTAGKVIRANGAAHTKPCVIPLNSDGSETDCLIDLLKDKGLQITAALTYQAATGKPIDEPKFAQAG